MNTDTKRLQEEDWSFTNSHPSFSLASLLIIWWCTCRCGIGALQTVPTTPRAPCLPALYRRLGTRQLMHPITCRVETRDGGATTFSVRTNSQSTSSTSAIIRLFDELFLTSHDSSCSSRTKTKASLSFASDHSQRHKYNEINTIKRNASSDTQAQIEIAELESKSFNSF